MNYLDSARYLKDQFSRLKIEVPTLHIVLGSGLGEAKQTSKDFEDVGEIPFKDVPGLVATTVVGHKGVYKYLRHKLTKKIVTFQSGRLHGFEGHLAKDAVNTVMGPRLTGTKKFILTNAAGSLTSEFEAGSVMIIKDHVNLTGQNPLVGPLLKNLEGQDIGPRFPDMSEPYNLKMNARLKTELLKQDLRAHEGTYLGLLGPTFETPAEVRTFGSWGLHAVGMSTVWEAIALKHSGASISGMSFISNQGCGIEGKKNLSHEEVFEASRRVGPKITSGLLSFAARELELKDDSL